MFPCHLKPGFMLDFPIPEKDAPVTTATQPRSAQELTAERQSTHGDYDEMSAAVMAQMAVFTKSKNWEILPDGVKTYFLNVAQKNARILTGNPLEPDHFDDVSGYAHLASKTVHKELARRESEGRVLLKDTSVSGIVAVQPALAGLARS